MKKTLCFFGSYNKTHRNNALIKGLRDNGYEALECYDNSKKPFKYVKLFLKHWKLRKQYDVMLIGFPNQGLVLFAKMITRKPIIFDPFISLYNSIVEDRKSRAKYGPRSIASFYLDKFSVRLADSVLIDTMTHAAYFSRTFKVALEKFILTPVGSDDELFHPEKNPEKNTTKKIAIKFYGSYTPLQGIQYIVRAAKLLEKEEDIHFYLMGHGQTLKEMTQLSEQMGVKNLTFIKERIPIECLKIFMQSADVCLGIFGGTIKSNMVVPHKVYDALALQKPVITGDTPAIHEFFTNGENILLCNEADPEDLAEKIMLLKNDETLRSRMAEQGKALLTERFTPKHIVKNILLKIEMM